MVRVVGDFYECKRVIAIVNSHRQHKFRCVNLCRNVNLPFVIDGKPANNASPSHAVCLSNVFPYIFQFLTVPSVKFHVCRHCKTAHHPCCCDDTPTSEITEKLPYPVYDACETLVLFRVGPLPHGISEFELRDHMAAAGDV